MRLQLDRIGIRVRDSYKAAFACEAALVDAIAARCTETDSGARDIEHILSRTLLPELSAAILARPADNRASAPASSLEDRFSTRCSR